jgi:hypothetical protein
LLDLLPVCEPVHSHRRKPALFAVMGSQTRCSSTCASQSEESTMPVKKHTFKAVLEKHHHHKTELVVTGDVTEPTTGWTVTLERANPQGINPRILLLKLVETPPAGNAGDIVTTHHVKYDESPVMGDYTQVSIEGVLTIDVHHAMHA